MEKISLVIPCYNEEEVLPLFYERINQVISSFKKVKFEVILVNDGSKDKTLLLMRNFARENKNFRYISFSRNFGKESAILAGLEYATGDYIATMDADLQDPPELLHEMYDTIKSEDFDCVATRSVSRNGYGIFRKMFTGMYYFIINKISKTEIVSGARDFRLMSRQMLNSILELREYNRYSKGIFAWVGYNTKWITFENQERAAGTTKWNFFRLFSYSLESIMGFSTVPLLFSSFIGIVFCLIAFITIVVVIISTLIFSNPVAGWPSLVSIILFVTGIQLFCLGIVSQYLSKMYLEVKNRPVYIIKETENDK